MESFFKMLLLVTSSAIQPDVHRYAAARKSLRFWSHHVFLVYFEACSNSVSLTSASNSSCLLLTNFPTLCTLLLQIVHAAKDSLKKYSTSALVSSIEAWSRSLLSFWQNCKDQNLHCSVPFPKDFLISFLKPLFQVLRLSSLTDVSASNVVSNLSNSSVSISKAIEKFPRDLAISCLAAIAPILFGQQSLASEIPILSDNDVFLASKWIQAFEGALELELKDIESNFEGQSMLSNSNPSQSSVAVYSSFNAQSLVPLLEAMATLLSFPNLSNTLLTFARLHNYRAYFHACIFHYPKFYEVKKVGFHRTSFRFLWALAHASYCSLTKDSSLLFQEFLDSYFQELLCRTISRSTEYSLLLNATSAVEMELPNQVDESLMHPYANMDIDQPLRDHRDGVVASSDNASNTDIQDGSKLVNKIPRLILTYLPCWNDLLDPKDTSILRLQAFSPDFVNLGHEAYLTPTISAITRLIQQYLAKLDLRYVVGNDENSNNDSNESDSNNGSDGNMPGSNDDENHLKSSDGSYFNSILIPLQPIDQDILISLTWFLSWIWSSLPSLYHELRLVLTMSSQRNSNINSLTADFLSIVQDFPQLSAPHEYFQAIFLFMLNENVSCRSWMEPLLYRTLKEVYENIIPSLSKIQGELLEAIVGTLLSSPTDLLSISCLLDVIRICFERKLYLLIAISRLEELFLHNFGEVVLKLPGIVSLLSDYLEHDAKIQKDVNGKDSHEGKDTTIRTDENDCEIDNVDEMKILLDRSKTKRWMSYFSGQQVCFRPEKSISFHIFHFLGRIGRYGRRETPDNFSQLQSLNASSLENESDLNNFRSPSWKSNLYASTLEVLKEGHLSENPLFMSLVYSVSNANFPIASLYPSQNSLSLPSSSSFVPFSAYSQVPLSAGSLKDVVVSMPLQYVFLGLLFDSFKGNSEGQLFISNSFQSILRYILCQISIWASSNSSRDIECGQFWMRIVTKSLLDLGATSRDEVYESLQYQVLMWLVQNPFLADKILPGFVEDLLSALTQHPEKMSRQAATDLFLELFRISSNPSSVSVPSSASTVASAMTLSDEFLDSIIHHLFQTLQHPKEDFRISSLRTFYGLFRVWKVEMFPEFLSRHLLSMIYHFVVSSSFDNVSQEYLETMSRCIKRGCQLINEGLSFVPARKRGQQIVKGKPELDLFMYVLSIGVFVSFIAYLFVCLCLYIFADCLFIYLLLDIF